MSNIGLFIFIGFVASFILLILFNKLPISWFCDYGEAEPDASYKKKVSLTYWLLPLTLLLTFCFYILWKSYPLHQSFLLCFSIFLLLQITLSDLLYRIIPDQHVIGLFILGCLYILAESSSVTPHFISAFIGGILHLIIALIGLLFKSQDAIGFGDIKLMAALGFMTGVYDILFIFVLTTLLSTAFLIGGLVLRRISLQSTIPLAPFVSVSWVLCFLL